MDKVAAYGDIGCSSFAKFHPFFALSAVRGIIGPQIGVRLLSIEIRSQTA
jgi:hypothetical protein